MIFGDLLSEQNISLGVLEAIGSWVIIDKRYNLKCRDVVYNHHQTFSHHQFSYLYIVHVTICLKIDNSTLEVYFYLILNY